MEQLSEVFIWSITHCTTHKFALLPLDWVILVVFILRTCTRLDELRQHFVVRLVLRLKYKDLRKTHYSPNELPFVVRRSRRISKETSSRCIMHLVPVFILETHNHVCPSSSWRIKTAIVYIVRPFQSSAKKNFAPNRDFEQHQKNTRYT